MPREKINTNLKPGFVNSHIKSFATHGNGPTIAENAIDNLHRLNRDMTEEEKERIAIVN